METVFSSRRLTHRFTPIFLGFCVVLLGFLKETDAQITFTVQPKDTTINAGQPVSLDCTATADRRVRYSWTKMDQKIIADDSRIFIHKNGTLHYTSVVRKDAGDYNCIATSRSSGRKSSKKSKVAVLSVQAICNAVKILTEPSGSSFAAGKQITLKCKCSGYPQPATKWHKDNSPFTTRSGITFSGNKIIFQSPISSDSGKYQCNSSNILGNRTSGDFDLLVINAIAPVFTVKPNNSVVAIGSTVTLQCKANGTPKPTIKWYFKTASKALSDNSKYTISKDGPLTIKSITSSEIGKYKCEAENIQNSLAVETTVKEAYIDPFTIQPSIQYVEVGKELLVACKPQGLPAPAVTWVKADDSPLPSSYTVKDGSTLKNAKVEKSDRGMFKCHGKNIAGIESSSVEIIPSVFPTITTEPKDTLAEESKKVILDCVVSSYPPAEVWWIKDNMRVIKDENHVTGKNGSLIIKKTSLKDGGFYQCIAKHKGRGPDASRHANVTVIAAVKLLSEYSRDHHKFNKGTKQKISCIFSGHKPITVKWKKVGSKSLPKTAVPNGDVLEFKRVQMSDSGIYTCTGSNFFSSFTARVNVTVYVYPQFDWKPRNTTVVEAESVWLHCNASGDPKPKINWGKEKYGGDRLNKERFHQYENGTLHVKNILLEDTGRYYCLAANIANFKQITISLRVVSPPKYTASKSAAMGRTIGIAVGCAAAYIVLVVGLMIYCKSRRAKQQRKEREQLALPVDVELENCEGNAEMALQPVNGKPHKYNKMEFPRHDLESLKPLGTGSYGRAFLARASGVKDGERETMVVVKSLTSKDHILIEDFRREMSALVNMDNSHVVSLLGVCREMDPLYMIFESLEKGDLKQYLLSCHDGPNTLTSSQKLSMCTDIVSGLTYLAANDFVHKDVAARNCMVTKDLQVKIGFLSLSYDLYNGEYYRYNNILIPLRWMAPEAISNDDFTEKSDVWSFGVLAWEVYTLGQTPYEGRPDEEVLKCVTDDLRLPKPDNCPERVTDVMAKCWENNVDDRPTFEAIFADISEVAVDSHV